MVQDRDLRNAGLIASAQRIEHYEIAVYGSLAT
jgi:ferritin-like metal-binding protein YciE